jgi:hypothetical protein
MNTNSRESIVGLIDLAAVGGERPVRRVSFPLRTGLILSK